MDEKTIARFWSHVERTSDTGCWLWRGTQAHGYGCFFAERGSKRKTRAHRFSWLIAYGEIPSGLVVCHRCDVPQCVAPHHLFLGTRRDNSIDMAMKCRGVSIHSVECVDAMKREWASGATTTQLAAKFGGTPSGVWRVVRGKTRRHVSPQSQPGREVPGRVRLTIEGVREIRRCHASGTETPRQMADRFGVEVSTVRKVVTRRNWAWVE